MPEADPTPEADPEVSEIINKRGRRCEYEYECRWLGRGADETTWESAESLTSAASRQAIIEFELQFMKSHSHS